MCCRKGRGVAASFSESETNLSGLSEPTKAKEQAECCTSSGVIKPLSLCQLK